MGFTGFSSDQEGSIVYDGEKFIINNPEKAPENFDSDGKPVIYTQPPASTAPNNQPAPATTHQQNNMLNQDFNYVVAGVGEPKDKRKKKKKKKRDALAAGSGGQAIAGFSEHEGTPDISEAGLLDFEPEEATSLTGYTAVSEGQRQHIDYLLSTVNDDLAWVALVVIKEYGLPSKEQYAEYMAQFAESGLADESDRLALELLDEVRHSDWDDLLAQADSESVETVAQDLADNTREVPSIGIEVSGILRAYKLETFVRGVDSPHVTYEISDTPGQFRYLRTSDSGNGAFLIEIDNEEYWIDTLDPDAEFAIGPFVEHENYPIQTFAQIIATDDPDPTATPKEYVLQSIVGEEEEVPVAMSFRPYDASGVGLISQDYNKITDIYRPFQVQSPVVGPDVRVEFVVPAGTNDTTLGNYVVISFPASVYFEDETIMRSLSNDRNHDPRQWREDGRIFIAYGHLSKINTKHIYPGNTIDTLDEAIIGKTGNTGLQNPQPHIKHYNQHLDLAIVYYGSNMPGEMEKALQTYRSDRDNVHFFFGYANRSTLDQNNDSRLYGENIDPERIPGLF